MKITIFPIIEAIPREFRDRNTGARDFLSIQVFFFYKYLLFCYHVVWPWYGHIAYDEDTESKKESVEKCFPAKKKLSNIAIS